MIKLTVITTKWVPWLHEKPRKNSTKICITMRSNSITVMFKTLPFHPAFSVFWLAIPQVLEILLNCFGRNGVSDEGHVGWVTGDDAWSKAKHDRIIDPYREPTSRAQPRYEVWRCDSTVSYQCWRGFPCLRFLSAPENSEERYSDLLAFLRKCNKRQQNQAIKN